MPAASPSDGLDVVVRPARDSDAEGLIELIGGCFAEYPDCVMDVDGEIPELRAIATYASQRNGAFWTVDQGEEVIGCIGAVPLDDGGIELIKLYVRADARGQGLGRRLISQVETFACEREAAFIELWTDTRFTTAHIAYLACGYRKMADTRELRDKSNTIEYRFRKQLTKEA